MPVSFNSKTYQFIRKMRLVDKLLEVIDLDKLGINGPTGAAICSDCFIKKDVDNHFQKLWRDLSTDELISELKWFGVPLYFDPDSILVDLTKFNQDLWLLEQIKLGLQVGRIKDRFIILGHYPCGVAGLNDISFFDAIQHYVHGRQQIINSFPDLPVSIWLHVDYTQSENPELNKKTYHLDSGLWLENSAQFEQYDHTTRPCFRSAVG